MNNRVTPFLTVDIIINLENKGIILIKRKNPPYGWALPGGFVDVGESVEHAAIREAKEETNLDICNLKQFHVYSDPSRDPRMHTVATVFTANAIGTPRAGDDAQEFMISDLYNLPKLAFDHDIIVTDYKNQFAPQTLAHDLISIAEKEDFPFGDCTSEIIFDDKHTSKAQILVKEDCIISGLQVIEQIVKRHHKNISCDFHYKNGDRVNKGKNIATITGTTKLLLTYERLMLNFLQRLSGIATYTRQFTEKMGNHIEILDTRKTTPGLRYLEKEAVVHGGGKNHRMNLSDMIMIKDTHIRAVGSITEALRKIRNAHLHKKVEVEVRTIEEVYETLSNPPDIIMLDNMSYADMQKAIQLINKKSKIELSGGVSLDSINEYKNLDIDYCSVGSLTHSARAIDISMKIE